MTTVNAASAIPVAIHGISVNSALLALMNLLIGGALVTWLKTRPKTQEIANARRKDDLESLRGRVDELEDQVTRLLQTVKDADERAHQAELMAAKEAAIAETKLSRAATAVQLVIGELEKVAPEGRDNPVIRQARELIASAATGDSGFSGYLDRLSTLPGAVGPNQSRGPK